MQIPHQPIHSDRLGQEAHQVKEAARFAAVIGAIGVGFVVMAAVWVSTCNGAMAVDTAACGTPQRTLLALGAPGILLIGGVWAFLRTYRVWRDDGVWWGWQGAGWFLLTLMLLTLTVGAPGIAGPVFAG